MTRVLSAVVVCLVLSAPRAFAQWDTYVSHAGSDANTCIATAPCATFQRAFDVIAANGVIHVVDSGVYGSVLITHGVTIDGGGMATTLLSAGAGIHTNSPQFSVVAGSTDVVSIQNFTISGSGQAQIAIGVTTAGALHVENCSFSGFTSTAINFQATGGLLAMKHVHIYDMQSATGVYVNNARASLDDVTLNRLQTGVLSVGSSTVTVHRSTANGNAEGFAAAYGPTAELHVDDCLMTNNQWGVVVSNGARAYLGRSTLNNNFIAAMFNDGASILVSYGDNHFVSNASDGLFTSTIPLK
jgi:hypothetical protein